MTNELEPEDVTLDLIYEHTHGGPTRQLAAGDAIDAKAVQIFAAASVVLGFGTFTTADLDTQLRCCMEPPPPRISAPAAPRGWSFKRGVIASLMGPIDGGRATASRSPTHVREQILDDIASAPTKKTATCSTEKGGRWPHFWPRRRLRRSSWQPRLFVLWCNEFLDRLNLRVRPAAGLIV